MFTWTPVFIDCVNQLFSLKASFETHPQLRLRWEQFILQFGLERGKQQCDQTARLFWSILPIKMTKISHNSIKNCQINFKVLPRTDKTLKIEKDLNFYNHWRPYHSHCCGIGVKINNWEKCFNGPTAASFSSIFVF